MSAQELSDVSESLASRVRDFLARRYPSERLDFLARNLMGDERALAQVLIDYRKAAGWPNPSDMYAIRCVSCNRIMGDDESSAFEDENVCKRCAAKMSASLPPLEASPKC